MSTEQFIPKPDIKISVKQTFGFDSEMEVGGFSKIIDILKGSQSSKGVSEKRIMLDKNRENMLIEEVEEIWKQIDQENNWHFLEQKISKVRNIGSLLESQKLVNF